MAQALTQGLPIEAIGERIYESIFRNASVGILLYSREEGVVFANDIMAQITGYAVHDLTGNRFFELTIPDEQFRATFLEKLSRAVEEPLDFDLAILKKSGEKMDLSLSSSYFYMEGASYILLVLQNITQRKAFEKVIESSFDKFIQVTIDLDEAMKKIQDQQSILEKYKLKMENELRVAHAVQNAIVPVDFPSNEYVDIWGVCLPSSEVGGDFIDVFDMGDYRLGIVCTDVSGHGVPSALITTMVKAYFTQYTREYEDPAVVMEKLNRELIRMFQNSGFYLTACYSVIDLKTMQVITAVAGHPNPYRHNPRTGEVSLIGNLSGGVIVGCLPPEVTSFVSATNQLEEGDTLLYYTDGIYEARAGDDDNEFYGEDRLSAFLSKHHQAHPREIVDNLIKDVDAYFKGFPPNDDRSLIAVRVKKKAVGEAREIQELFNRGQEFYDTGRYEDAREAFSRIVKTLPGSLRAHFFLGLVHGKMRTYDEAEKSFLQVVEINPDYHKARYYLGAVYYNQRKYEEAQRVWHDLRGRVGIGAYRHLNKFLEKVGRILKK